MMTMLLVLLLLLSNFISLSLSLRVLVILKIPLWEYDVYNLISNTSIQCNYNSTYHWRNNTITKVSVTDFGIVELHNDDNNNDILTYYNDYSQCLLHYYNNNIKYITIDKMNTIKQLTYSDQDHYMAHRRDDGQRGFKYVKLDNQGRHLNGIDLLNENEGNKKESIKFIPSSIARDLHDKGYSGKGIKVAVFDTGMIDKHPHFKNVKLRTDWTSDNVLDDTVGHGSFCAGIIAGTDSECSGIAQDSELYVFRVFTSTQATFTSWFLDAFNYVLYLDIDVLNLSIGGPDHADKPFVDKIHELSGNGIVVISAVGNDGPKWGTQYNPADMADVLGVGGWDLGNGVSSFSSRGMTAWDLPKGFGHVKPDLIAPSKFVYSSQHSSPFKCRMLSGTSVAAPTVAGATVLLMSTTDLEKRKKIKNIAAIKQILMSSSSKLKLSSIFEQGAGIMNITSAYEYLKTFEPHASLHPPHVSNLVEDCPYMWPWCTQSIYIGAQPFLANFTLLNSIGLRGKVESVEWIECVGRDRRQCTSSTYHAIKHSSIPNLLRIETSTFIIHIDHNDVIWPWTGYIGVSIAAKSPYTGIVFCELKVKIESPGIKVSPNARTASATFDLMIISTPPRKKRILWDMYHSLGYPSAFVPKDDLANLQTQDMLDWHGDHPYLNFRELYIFLTSRLGYYVEILRGPWTCFDANQYQTLLVIDTEEDIEEVEINKIENDIRNNGLSILILAEWYDELKLLISQFNDENTRSRWYPITGGSNIPAVNKLLSKFGALFGLQSFQGEFKINNVAVKFTSGNTIAKWPSSQMNSSHSLKSYVFKSKSGEIRPSAAKSLRAQTSTSQVMIGMLDIDQYNNNTGRIIAYGDTTFFDKDEVGISQANMNTLITIFMNFINDGTIDKVFTLLDKPYHNQNLLTLGRALTASELKELENERKGRQFEYSRYSKFEQYHYDNTDDICLIYS